MLDGIRAIAVAIVVFFHAGILLIPGDLGVDIFFVLSGFLITWLLLKEWTRTGTISLKAFYARRTLRIFPAYYALILATWAAHQALGREWTKAQWLSSILYGVDIYIPWVGGLSHPINQAWSLAIEEQFYLLWPAALILILRRNERALLWALAVVIAVVALSRSVAVILFNVSWFAVAYSFWFRLDSLATGCLLAVLLRAESRASKIEALTRRPWLAPLTALSIVALRLFPGRLYFQSIGFTIEALLIAATLVQLLHHHQPMFRWLESPIVRLLGLLSYSIYLWHAWALR